MKKDKFKKISFFYHSLSGAGGERVIVDLANEFSIQGVVVDMILMNKEGILISRLAPRVNLVILNSNNFLSAVFKLTFYLFRNKPDALISISPLTHLVSFLAKSLSLNFSTKLIFRVGIPYSKLVLEYSKIKDKFVLFLVQIIYPLSYVVVAVSEGIKNDLINFLFFKNVNIKVIYNPKNLDQIKNKSIQIPDNFWFESVKSQKLPIVIGVGRLRSQKDFISLVKAFALVVKKIDSRLIILGEGSQRQLIEDQIRLLGLVDKVYMPGFVFDVESYIGHSDVFVSTSLWEGLPNVVIEALILGVPIVATDCPYGTREILAPGTKINSFIKSGIEQASNGILVPMRSVDDISEAILLLLKDKKIIDFYRSRSTLFSNIFDHKNIAQNYLNLIYKND